MGVHVFLQKIDGTRVVEHGQREEAPTSSIGYVLEASYLAMSESIVSGVAHAPAAWWTRLLRWLAKSPLSGASASGAQLRFVVPFGPDGGDALGLLDAGLPPVRPGDTPDAGIRSARGRAVALHGDDPILFHDLWVEEEGWRVALGRDFALVTHDSSVVIVSCGLAPLIVAPPRRIRVGEHLPRWTPRLRRLHPKPTLDVHGWSVSVREGDDVEVLGVVRPIQQSQRKFRLEATSDPYRALPARPNQVLGDEDGTRLVMRVVAREG